MHLIYLENYSIICERYKCIIMILAYALSKWCWTVLKHTKWATKYINCACSLRPEVESHFITNVVLIDRFVELPFVCMSTCLCYVVIFLEIDQNLQIRSRFFVLSFSLSLSLTRPIALSSSWCLWFICHTYDHPMVTQLKWFVIIIINANPNMNST